MILIFNEFLHDIRWIWEFYMIFISVIGLYILIDLEIHSIFTNSSKIYKFSKKIGLVFINPEVFPRIWFFVFLTKKSIQFIQIHYDIKSIN